MKTPPGQLVTPVQASIHMLDRDLTRLWEQVSETNETNRNVLRVCSLTLVTCVSERAALEHTSAVIQGITRTAPNRAIVLLHDSHAPAPKLEAWVQANCQIGAPGRPHVCGEQITIESEGPDIAPALGVVLTLLLPDLPVVLWLPEGTPANSPVFARLRSLVDHLIVDSERAGSAEQTLRWLAETPTSHALSDLAWARLQPWRELIAQFFDAPALVPWLARMERVTIDYERPPEPAPSNHVTALLLAGWLAVCLGWWLDAEDEGSVHTEGEVISLRLHAAGPRRVAVELRPTPATHGSSTLAAVRLEAAAEDGSSAARFIVEHTDTPDTVRTTAEVAGLPTMSRVSHVERCTTETLLARAVGAALGSHDVMLEKTLRMVGAFGRVLI